MNAPKKKKKNTLQQSFLWVRWAVLFDTKQLTFITATQTDVYAVLSKD